MFVLLIIFSSCCIAFWDIFMRHLSSLRILRILVLLISYSPATGPESRVDRPLTVEEPSEVLQRLQLEAVGKDFITKLGNALEFLT